MTAFERRVKFEPGYNYYLHETGLRRRGQHGMSIRFLLIGDKGAAQFLMQTFWTPLGEVDKDAPGREPCHIDHWDLSYGHPSGRVRAPSGSDLGYHWTTPLYEGQEEYGRADCDVLPGGTCYYDGSGLAADDVLRDFISDGDEAVWSWLEKRYQWCLEAEAEMQAARP